MKIRQKIQSFNEYRYSKSSLQTEITDTRINCIVKLAKTNNRILDIGCYDGLIDKKLISNGNDVTGLDISQGAVKLARKNGIKAFQFNIEEESFPKHLGKFDLVLAGEIIEHIFDPDEFLNKIHSILKPGGHLILTTPNLVGLGSRLSFTFGNLPWMIENDLLPGKSGHIRYFTYSELEKVLTRQGFMVETFTTDSVGINKLTIPLLHKFFPTLGRILIVKARKL